VGCHVVSQSSQLQSFLACEMNQMTDAQWILYAPATPTPTKIPLCPLYVFRNKQPLSRNTRKGDRKGAYGFWWGYLKERHHLDDLGVDGSIILRQIFKQWDGGHGLDWYGSGNGPVPWFCEYSNEPSGSIKSWEFLDTLKTCWILKKDSAYM